MRRTIWRLVLIAVAAMPTAARAEWSFDAAAQARYNDNVGDAELASDILSDEILAAQLSLSQYLPIGHAYLFSMGADVQGEWYQHLRGLNDVGANASIALRRKFGLGAYAPWLRAAIGAGRNAVNDPYRNTTRYRASLGAGKRVTARLNLWLEYSFERRAAWTISDGESACRWIG